MTDVAQIIAEIEAYLLTDGPPCILLTFDEVRALLDEVKRQRQENWEWKQAADVEARQRRHETDRATTAESRLREAVEVIRQLRIHVPHNSISAERARAFLSTLETNHE